MPPVAEEEAIALDIDIDLHTPRVSEAQLYGFEAACGRGQALDVEECAALIAEVWRLRRKIKAVVAAHREARQITERTEEAIHVEA